MIRIRFYLRDPKLEETTIYLFVRKWKKKVLHERKFSLNISIKTSSWDQEKQKVVERHKNDYIAKGINLQLSNIRNEVEKIVGLAMMDGKDEFEAVTDYMQQDDDSQSDLTLQKAIDIFLKSLNSRISSQNVSRSRIKTFYEFYKNKPISLINQRVGSNFADYCRKRFSVNTAHGHYKTFKQFCNFYFKRNLINKFEFEKLPTKSADSFALTKEQLEIVKNLQLSESLNNIRNLFLIMCYSSVRVSDLKQLLEQDMSQDLVFFKSHKTGQDIFIPVTNPLREVIAKKVNLITAQKINLGLKEIASQAGIKEKVTNHTARRTFVTLSLQLGVPAELVMKVTGHTSAAILQKYIRHNKDYLISELNKAWK